MWNLTYWIFPSAFSLGNDFIFFTSVTFLPLIHKELTLSLHNLFTLKASLPHLCWCHLKIYLYPHLFLKLQNNCANFYCILPPDDQRSKNRIYLSTQSYPFLQVHSVNGITISGAQDKNLSNSWYLPFLNHRHVSLNIKNSPCFSKSYGLLFKRLLKLSSFLQPPYFHLPNIYLYYFLGIIATDLIF